MQDKESIVNEDFANCRKIFAQTWLAPYPAPLFARVCSNTIKPFFTRCTTKRHSCTPSLSDFLPKFCLFHCKTARLHTVNTNRVVNRVCKSNEGRGMPHSRFFSDGRYQFSISIYISITCYTFYKERRY